MPPHIHCVASPRRSRCCRVCDNHPCREIIARIEQVEAALSSGRVSLELAADALADLLPGTQHGFSEPPLPFEPTSAPAGSDEKIEVMRRRVAAGLSPFHPDDSREIRHYRRYGSEDQG